MQSTIGMDTTQQSRHGPRLSTAGDWSGFNPSTFHAKQPSMSTIRDRGSIPAINTGRAGQHIPSTNDMQTPGTGYDMNYTPLLPSQLLMGSPFQPGSPSTFQSPQYQSFANFSPHGPPGQQQNHAGNIGSPLQAQQPMSPIYQSMVSPGAIGGPQSFPPQQGPGAYGNMGNAMGSAMSMGPGMVSGTSRTVYLGNIPPDTPAEEILGHVRSGQIESVRMLPDKNCCFISFLDSSSAVHFHSDAILKKLNIRGQDIKIGWGKPSQVPSSVALATQQSGASRNVYLGNLPPETTEDELREDLSKFGFIDTMKIVREKAIGFVHFLSIGSAIKAVTQLPQDPKWQAPKRVFYGKDRCAYVSKTQQQNAAQYLGIAPGYAHVLNSADRDLISNALAQQSVAAAAVATAAGGVNNLGNRTVYLGNIHPETTSEEICNVVRGGLLHHIRYIPDKHICFVTFIDPTAAASFYALSNMQGLMIHNRRLKIGWGKHSGALPPAIALAVSGGASRNVYIGNIDETWSEDRLRQDFSEYGEIELVNALREKSCAFVNFTNIANAIKAIEAIRNKEEYRRFKINFGKDRCGNPPRQNSHNNGQNQNQSQFNQQGGMQINPEGITSPTLNGVMHPSHSSQAGSSASHSASGALPNGPGHSFHRSHPSTASASTNNNPLTAYLNQMSNTQNPQSPEFDHMPQPSFQQGGHGHTNSLLTGGGHPSSGNTRNSLEPPRQPVAFSNHGSSNSFSVAAGAGGVAGSTVAPTYGGLLAPESLNARAQHNRAVSLPAFSQGPFGQQGQQGVVGQIGGNPGFAGLGSGLTGLGGGSGSGGGGGAGSGFGLAIQGEGTLPRWAEEEVGS